MKDYYEILEVNKKASPEVIAKVYKLLAKKYHPDTVQDDILKKEAEDKFKEISEAYEVLSDNKKRAEFDIQLQQFEDEQKDMSSYISYDEYKKLKDYCITLENQINSYQEVYQKQPQYSNFKENVNSNPEINYNKYYQDNQKAYADAVNRVYQEAYINSLRNLGYKIKYKKTFKSYVKDFIAVILSLLIVSVFFYMCYRNPEIRNYFF